EQIIAPIAAQIPDGQRVVVIPDLTLSGVPFAALVDENGRHFVEKCPVIVAPSAAVFAQFQARRALAMPTPRALIVAGPPAVAGGGGFLGGESREEEAVAAIYKGRSVTIPHDAAAAIIEVRATDANIVHFVGHTRRERGGENAFVASRLAGAAGRLTMR